MGQAETETAALSKSCVTLSKIPERRSPVPEYSKLPEQSRQVIRYFREMFMGNNPTLAQYADFALAGYLLGLTDAGVLTSDEADRLMNDMKGV